MVLQQLVAGRQQEPIGANTGKDVVMKGFGGLFLKSHAKHSCRSFFFIVANRTGKTSVPAQMNFIQGYAFLFVPLVQGIRMKRNAFNAKKNPLIGIVYKSTDRLQAKTASLNEYTQNCIIIHILLAIR